MRGQITPKPQDTPPEFSAVLGLSRSFALPLWPASRAAVPRRLPASPPLPHGRGSWLTAWCVGRHCPVAHVKPRVPSPLTPDPSPLPGARGAMCDFHCSLKTQIPPLAPVKRGRGVGGEGASPLNTARDSSPIPASPGRARLPPSPLAHPGRARLLPSPLSAQS